MFPGSRGTNHRYAESMLWILALASAGALLTDRSPSMTDEDAMRRALVWVQRVWSQKTTWSAPELFDAVRAEVARAGEADLLAWIDTHTMEARIALEWLLQQTPTTYGKAAPVRRSAAAAIQGAGVLAPIGPAWVAGTAAAAQKLREDTAAEDRLLDDLAQLERTAVGTAVRVGSRIVPAPFPGWNAATGAYANLLEGDR